MVKQAGSAVRAGDVVSLNQQIACVSRELALRRKVYPNWVRLNKMRDEEAAREIWQMQAVLDTLRQIAGQPTAIQPSLSGLSPREAGHV